MILVILRHFGNITIVFNLAIEGVKFGYIFAAHNIPKNLCPFFLKLNLNRLTWINSSQLHRVCMFLNHSIIMTDVNSVIVTLRLILKTKSNTGV